MSFGNFVLQEIKAQSGEMLNKMRDACGGKVKIVKAFSEEPEYIGNSSDIKMHLAEDGTKACFMFNGTEQARKFAELLTDKLNVTADVSNFIGYGVVYVLADKYEETIQKGLNLLLDFNDGCWVDFYNERSPRGYEQVLLLRLSDSYFDERGNIKKMEEIVIKTWLKSLERVLGQKILFDEYFNRTVNVGIVRTKDAYQTHDAVLDKIRNSGLLSNSPFEGYAYVNYYGKTVR